MMARSSSITVIAIAWALSSVRPVAAQEIERARPVGLQEIQAAREKAAMRTLAKQAEAARLQMERRAAEERKSILRNAADLKTAAQREALKEALLRRAEALQAQHRQEDERRQEMIVELLLRRVAAQVGPDPAFSLRDGEPRDTIERFVNSMTFGEIDPARARTSFGRRLNTELDELRRTTGLTPAQEDKLRLAAEGDMKRFFDQVAAVRGKFVPASNDPVQKKVLLDEIRRLRAIGLAGPFGEGSLYSKVLEHMRREHALVEN